MHVGVVRDSLIPVDLPHTRILVELCAEFGVGGILFIKLRLDLILGWRRLRWE